MSGIVIHGNMYIAVTSTQGRQAHLERVHF